VALSGILGAIVDWLRAGYPNGVPQRDYVPLLAVLSRRLSDDEIRQVTDELATQGALPADRADVGVRITKLTDELPRADDVQRVLDHLRSAGGPAADDR
jgi:hypothetical protein